MEIWSSKAPHIKQKWHSSQTGKSHSVNIIDEYKSLSSQSKAGDITISGLKTDYRERGMRTSCVLAWKPTQLHRMRQRAELVFVLESQIKPNKDGKPTLVCCNGFFLIWILLIWICFVFCVFVFCFWLVRQETCQSW